MKQLIDEKMARAMKRDRWLEEKLTVVLEGWLTQAELEVNSEAEEMGEAEGSEAVRMEEVGMTGGTQSLAMEVDEEGEDEVVVVEEVKQGETMGNPRGNPTGRQGKAKVKLMMIVQMNLNMYRETI